MHPQTGQNIHISNLANARTSEISEKVPEKYRGVLKVICLVCADAEVTDDESSVAGQEEEDTQRGSVASVLAAKAPGVHPRFQTLGC